MTYEDYLAMTNPLADAPTCELIETFFFGCVLRSPASARILIGLVFLNRNEICHQGFTNLQTPLVEWMDPKGEGDCFPGKIDRTVRARARQGATLV